MTDGSSCAASEPFALQVLGTSMAPEFPDGCIIIIDPGGIVKHGCYVLAVDGANEFIFRQLEIREQVHYLVALEEGHEVIQLAGLIDIKGVVSQRAGKRRKHHKKYD